MLQLPSWEKGLFKLLTRFAKKDLVYELTRHNTKWFVSAPIKYICQSDLVACEEMSSGWWSAETLSLQHFFSRENIWRSKLFHMD